MYSDGNDSDISTYDMPHNVKQMYPTVDDHIEYDDHKESGNARLKKIKEVVDELKLKCEDKGINC